MYAIRSYYVDNDLLASCRLITSPAYLGDDQPHALYIASLKGKPSAYIIGSVAAEGYGSYNFV